MSGHEDLDDNGAGAYGPDEETDDTTESDAGLTGGSGTTVDEPSVNPNPGKGDAEEPGI